MQRFGVRAVRGVVVVVASVGVVGVSASRAQAAYAPQIVLPFTGLGEPYGVAVDGSGDLFVADSHATVEGNSQIVELSPDVSGLSDGTQTTLPFSGLVDPNGVAVDGAGDVFATDSRTHCVWRCDINTGVATRVAGSPKGKEGFADGIGDAALFVLPCQIVIDDHNHSA